MSRNKLLLIVTGLLCNLGALLLVAWVGFRKSPVDVTSRTVISIQLGQECVQKGIQLREWAKDGATEATNVAASECRVVRSPPGQRSFMYFIIDPQFKLAALMDVLVTVEYFDDGPGEFRLNYDAVVLPENKRSGYETAADRQKCLGSQRWQKAHFIAHDAQFKNSQNGGADFRLEVRMPVLYVRRVTVERLSERP